MYMTTTRDELHHLVDVLPEDQVAPALALMRERVSHTGADTAIETWPLPGFVGTLHSGKGDLAEQSDDILRVELGRYA